LCRQRLALCGLLALLCLCVAVPVGAGVLRAVVLPFDRLLGRRCCGIAAPMDDLDDDLTDDHMRVLQSLDVHPLGTSAAEMADALDLDADDVDLLYAELVAAGMIQTMRPQ